MTARLFAVALLLVVVPLASAAPPAAPSFLPQTDRYVYGELSLAQPSLTDLSIGGDLWAYRFDVRGKVYDADDIGQAFHQTNRFAGEPSGNAFVESVENAAKTSLQGIIERSFPDATITNVRATLDRSTLHTPSGNPLDPPVRISVTASVERTRQAVGLGNLTDAAVSAAFSAGASVAADLSLTADQGYRLFYAIGAPAKPSGIRFASGEGVASDGATFTVEVDNFAGTTPSKSASAKLYDPSVRAPTAEDIRSKIDVTMGAIEKGAAGIPISVAVDAEVRSLNVPERFPGALPSKVSLSFVNADGIRALRATGAIGEDDIKKGNERLLAEVKADVERAFGPDAAVTGGLDDASLSRAAGSPFAAEPPVLFRAASSTEYKVAGADGDDVDLALRIGGTANVDLTLFAANGRETTFTIRPPSIGEFTAAEGGQVTANGQTATFVVPAKSTEFPASLSLRGKDVPSFKDRDAELAITVDLADVDAGVGKLVGGDFGTLVVEVRIKGDLKVIEVPESLEGTLPENLELTHLSSDAIRLLVDRGFVSENNLTSLEKSLLEQVAQKLGAALGGEIPVTGKLDRASLDVGLVATPISGDSPVVFTATAKLRKPLAGGPIEAQSAIALYTQQLPLSLPRIEGLDTVYTVIAPRGLAFTDVSGTGGDVERGEAADGRDQFTVRPTSDSATMNVSIAVTPAFVMIKFWPLVLGLVLLLVLIIGTPIALVRMRRRKNGKKGA